MNDINSIQFNSIQFYSHVHTNLVRGIFVPISQHQGSKQDGIHWPKTCAGSGDEIMDTPDTGRRHTDVLSISYPESSGCLASGWSPEETLGY